MKIIIYTSSKDVNLLLRSRLIATGHEVEIVHNNIQLKQAAFNTTQTAFYLDESPTGLACLSALLSGGLSASEFSPVAMLVNNKPDFLSGKLGAFCILQPPMSLTEVDQSLLQLKHPKRDFIFIPEIYTGLERRVNSRQQRHCDRRLTPHANESRYRPILCADNTVAWKKSINNTQLAVRLNQFRTDLKSALNKEPIIKKLANEMHDWGFTKATIRNITQQYSVQVA